MNSVKKKISFESEDEIIENFFNFTNDRSNNSIIDSNLESKINLFRLQTSDDNTAAIGYVLDDVFAEVFRNAEGWQDIDSENYCDDDDDVGSDGINTERAYQACIDDRIVKLNQNISTTLSGKLDRRLKRWQSYLEIRKNLCKKICKKLNDTNRTCKDLLLLSSDKYRKREFIKNLLNYIDENLIRKQCDRQPVKGKEIENVEDIWETVPEKEFHEIVDVPLITKIEEGLYDDGVLKRPYSPVVQDDDHDREAEEIKDKWLTSNYLQRNLKIKNLYIQEILPHFPDIDELQVIGQKIHLKSQFEISDDNIRKDLIDNAEKSNGIPRLISKIIERSSTSLSSDIKYLESQQNQYVIRFNKRYQMNMNSKCNYNLITNSVFEAKKIYDKQHKIVLQLENLGCKAVYFEWKQNENEQNIRDYFKKHLFKKKHTFMPILTFDTKRTKPTFYFDQNVIKLNPGKMLKMEITYCSSEYGIHTEQWHLLTTKPNFFVNDKKFIINLFGYCDFNVNDRIGMENDIKNLEAKINIDSMKNLNFDIIDCCAKTIFSTTAPNIDGNDADNDDDDDGDDELLNYFDDQQNVLGIPKIPYKNHFTEEELFLSKNRHCNYLNESILNELKFLYNEVCENELKITKKWNYDLLELRDLILKIDNNEKRKKFFEKFHEILNQAKTESKIPKRLQNTITNTLRPTTIIKNIDIYENQKIVLVRNILASYIQIIDNIGYNLKNSFTGSNKINTNLEYDEVIVDNMDSNLSMTMINRNTVDKFSQGDTKLITNTTAEKMYGRKTVPNSSPDTSVSVIKTNVIKSRQDKMFRDVFYMKIYSQLGQAAEDIAGVIRGMKNLL